MHLLYFHQHFSTTQGSTGTRSYELSKYFVSLGHKVTVVCGNFDVGESGLNKSFIFGKREGIVDGIRVIQFNISYSNSDSFVKRSLSFLIYAIRSIGISLFKKYDLVLCTSTPLTASIPGIFAKIFRGKKFIFEVRDLWPELPRALGVISNKYILKTLVLLEKSSYHFADKCIGLSPGIVDGIIKNSKKNKQVQLIPNGCDLALFESYKKEFFTKKDGAKFTALYTGTHGVANGLDFLLDVAEEIKSLDEQLIEIVLIGSGMLKDDLKKNAEARNLDNLIFRDPVPKKDLIPILKKADIGLQILKDIPEFQFGTSPNKFFDYIAAGIPVVTNYSGWVAELIEENNCGSVESSGSPKSFAQKIIALKNNSELVKEMSNNSLELANLKFNRSVLAKKWAKYITSG